MRSCGYAADTSADDCHCRPWTEYGLLGYFLGSRAHVDVRASLLVALEDVTSKLFQPVFNNHKEVQALMSLDCPNGTIGIGLVD